MTIEQCIVLATICVFEKRDDFSDSTLMDVLSFLTDEWRVEQERKDVTPFDDPVLHPSEKLRTLRCAGHGLQPSAYGERGLMPPRMKEGDAA